MEKKVNGFLNLRVLDDQLRSTIPAACLTDRRNRIATKPAQD